MAGGILQIGSLKPSASERVQRINVRDEAMSAREYIKRAQKEADNGLRSRDSFEKAIETVENMYSCYTPPGVVKGMPKSVFGDRFGWDMQEDISDCMEKFYAGKISEEELEGYFRYYCASMRNYRTRQCQTSGGNEDDNKQILCAIYDCFAKENMRAAKRANYDEGERINSFYGGDSQDWTYYNADYYYKCEETRDKLRRIAERMAARWEVSSFDVQEVEKNSKFTMDGGLDFNSGWNFGFRNQTGRSSLAKESMVPPKGFKMFFKERIPYAVKGKDDYSIAALEIWTEESYYKQEFAFKWAREGFEKQIFTTSELMKAHLSKEDNNPELVEFLGNLSVFTRQYSSWSKIVYKAGDYTPSEIKNRVFF